MRLCTSAGVATVEYIQNFLQRRRNSGQIRQLLLRESTMGRSSTAGSPQPAGNTPDEAGKATVGRGRAPACVLPPDKSRACLLELGETSCRSFAPSLPVRC